MTIMKHTPEMDKIEIEILEDFSTMNTKTWWDEREERIPGTITAYTYSDLYRGRSSSTSKILMPKKGDVYLGFARTVLIDGEYQDMYGVQIREIDDHGRTYIVKTVLVPTHIEDMLAAEPERFLVATTREVGMLSLKDGEYEKIQELDEGFQRFVTEGEIAIETCEKEQTGERDYEDDLKFRVERRYYKMKPTGKTNIESLLTERGVDPVEVMRLAQRYKRKSTSALIEQRGLPPHNKHILWKTEQTGRQGK